MGKKPENVFKEKALSWMKEQFPIMKIFPIQQVARTGDPDCLICFYGHFLALEFKASEKANRTKKQEYTLSEIDAAFGTSFFVYPENWEFIKRQLCDLYNKLRSN